MSTPEPISLAELEAPLEPVVHPNGRTLEVRPLDSLGAQLAAAVPEKDEDAVPYYWRVVRRCVPDITDQELEDLTIKQLDFVVSLASRQKNRVEEYLGKSQRSTDGPVVEASASETPSDTSSAESPSTRAEPSATSPSSPGTGRSMRTPRSKSASASDASSAATSP